MGCVDAQLAEDILAMGGDGVDARESFGCNLLGGLTLSDGFNDLRFRSRQDIGFLLFLLLGNNGFQCPLTEVACI